MDRKKTKSMDLESLKELFELKENYNKSISQAIVNSLMDSFMRMASQT
jgi:hypothetical protein